MAERKGTASPRWALWDRYVICGPDGRPHIERLRILQCPLAGVLAHRIHGPDPDPHPHDHPWFFWSLVLSGSYRERVWDNPRDLGTHRTRVRRRWSLARMPRTSAHQITATGGVLRTLVLTGPRRGSWRFWTEAGPVDWRDYLGTGAPDEP